MIIEINKDIDRYQESVVFGLTARQLLFAICSVAAGGSAVLFLYPYLDLTMAVYVAVPLAAPMALQGFYHFHGMSFLEVLRRRIHFAFFNKPLLYSSTEKEAVLKQYQDKRKNIDKKKVKEYFQ